MASSGRGLGIQLQVGCASRHEARIASRRSNMFLGAPSMSLAVPQEDRVGRSAPSSRCASQDFAMQLNAFGVSCAGQCPLGVSS